MSYVSQPSGGARGNKVLFTVFSLLAAAAIMQISAGNAGDKNWLLLAAREWLEGRVLYVDIFEVNPPLIVWLYAGIVRISDTIPFLQDYQVLALVGLAACALSVVTVRYMLAFHPAFTGQSYGRNRLTLLLATIFVFFTDPVAFFDREHILLVMTFPYLLRFMPSLRQAEVPLRWRLLIGCMAALGFCIKPHGIIIFCAVQLLCLLQKRNYRLFFGIENLLIGLAGLGYLAGIFILTPDYIYTVVPMALATYSAFNRRLIGIFYVILAFFVGGVSFADFRTRYASPYRCDIYYFIGLCGAFLLYAEANNGWGYTFQPLISLQLFLCGWLFLEYGWLKREARGKGLPENRFIFGQRACASILLCYTSYSLYAMGVFFITPSCERSADCINNEPYVRYLKDNQLHSFGALSLDFHKWPSLARLSGARFETRYNHLWMLPRLAEEKDSPRPDHQWPDHQWIIESVGEGLARDIEVRKPEAIFVEEDENFFGMGRKEDLLAFFLNVREFRQAWGHYRYDATIDRCLLEGRNGFSSQTGCRYAIYRYMP